MPLITLTGPGTSIYSSLQNCQTWNYSQGDGDKNTLIFQINTVSMKGQKVTSKMTYPTVLDLQKCQSFKGQETGNHHVLKVVVVHKGSSVVKGHYVAYIQPANGKSWSLFDDQTVSRVKEEEVLHQEASLLIYSRQLPPTLFGERKANQLTTDRIDPPNATTSHIRGGNEQRKPRKIPVRTPHTPMETIDHSGRQRGLQKFNDALREKLARSSTEWTPLLTITQWLSGQNRQRPCTILSDLDAHQIQTWIGQEQNHTSSHVTLSFDNRRSTESFSLCDRA